MILTVTLNPSVDINYKLESFKLDQVNRVNDVTKTAGGKGLNVSRVLRQLGEDVAAMGYLGGELGQFIRRQIKKIGIRDYFVKIEGESRNCIAVIHGGNQTEILEAGSVITEKEQENFLKKFIEYVSKVKLITISGSMPSGLPSDFYNQLLDIAGSKSIPVLLDTKGSLLKHALINKNKPFLIKPNKYEMEDLIARDLATDEDYLSALQSSLFNGVNLVVLTLGSNGAFVKHFESIYKADIPIVKAINPVGSGDAVIAGFAAGIRRKLPVEKLIKYGLSMGVLNAMEEKTGFINPDKIEWCMEEIKISKLGNFKWSID